jgi:alpha-beta hydrolase superfamily lysophospholipase
MAHRQFGAIAAPILLLQGTADEIVEPSEPEALAEVARQAGNRDVTVVPVEGADHSFAGAEIPTLAAVIAWLRERF